MVNIIWILYIGTYFQTQVKPEIVCNIRFEDYFRQDTVSVLINNVKIIEDVILTSNRSTGLTGLSMDLQFDSIFLHVLVFDHEDLQNTVSIDILEKIDLLVICNGIESKYSIELNNGKYIGLFKNNFDIILRQSRSKFVYD